MPGAFRDNAARILPVTIDLSRTDRDAQFLAVARSVVPDWADAPHAEVSVVDGGITNLLFLLRSGKRCPLLVRVYGDNTEVVIDREAENALFALLSRQGFSPVYWGRFANGRIEGWCEGYRALEPAEVWMGTNGGHWGWGSAGAGVEGWGLRLVVSPFTPERYGLTRTHHRSIG